MRKTHWVVITLVAVLAVAFSGLVPASAASTTKKLSSNFTLVNLDNGSNLITISYYNPDGTEWKNTDNTSANESFTFTTLGEQLIRRQYFSDLTAGRGSVVVTSDGPLGAVVQVQARDGQTPTTGAYSGVSDGASSVGVPLVIRRRNTASGFANSQIIIQNASSTAVNVEVDLINGETGATTYTKTGITIQPSAAYELDMDDDTDVAANVPETWFGSAVVRSTTAGGEVAVVSNFFTGPDAMQTFNGFPQASASAASTDAAQAWFAPLATSRLANGLSSVIAVQNVSGGSIPIDGIVLDCTKGDGSPDPATFQRKNTTAVGNTATYFFNPVTDLVNFPALWYGSCKVTTTGFATNMFVQLRFVLEGSPASRAAAYEGIAAGGTATMAVIPLYAKRLDNGFASSVLIQNLDEANTADVQLAYKAGEGEPAECTVTLNKTIPAGGSIQENHRIESGPNSVPEIPNDCFGTLTITSTNNRPIDGFVQLDFLNATTGDPYMAHNAFTISN